MTISMAEPWRSRTAITLLTIAWLLAVLTSVWRVFAIGMASWADEQSDNGAHSAALHDQAATAAMVLVAVAVGGPALIATLAFATGKTRTGVVYVVLTVVLGALALPLAANTKRTPAPAPSPPSAPAICQEHSGGDTQCPGG